VDKSEDPDFLGTLPPRPEATLATFASGLAAEVTKHLQREGGQHLVVVNFTLNIQAEEVTLVANETNTITAHQGANVLASQGSGIHILTGEIKAVVAPKERESLEAELARLTTLVEQLVAQLPAHDEAAKAKVDRALTTLKQEATSKTPDRAWYDVSAKGLLEAAKAVASLTAPITASVKAVHALLTGT
jgi:hypothetical protein